MKIVPAVLLCSTLLLGGVAFSQAKPDQHAAPAATSKTDAVVVPEYDPKRDAAADIKDAIALASKTHRRVLIEIGGKWCIWCTYLDKFFEQNSTLRTFRDQNFVMVKVNYSPENKNEKVISQYGKVSGYPHIFVLDSNGQLLHSQDTSKLEQGRGYSMAAVAKFLDDWKPKG